MVVAVNVPETIRFPGTVTEPLPSIVSLATPPVTKDMLSAEGLIIPVFESPSNFKAQLLSPPEDKAELVPSCRKTG